MSATAASATHEFPGLITREIVQNALQQRVLLYPEGVVLLNETGGTILDLCDGQRSIAAIAVILKERYHRDVAADVIEYLSQLVERELVRVE